MTATLLARRGVTVDRPSEFTWRVAPGPIAAIDETVEPTSRMQPPCWLQHW